MALLTVEEIALLIAINEHAHNRKAYEFSVDSAPTGSVISIGQLHFPPDLNTLGAPLENQERWLTALHTLRRERSFLTVESNIYSLSGAGRQMIERFKDSGRKTAAGVSDWDAINACLRNLLAAQRAQIEREKDRTTDKEVECLMRELLDLCGQLQGVDQRQEFPPSSLPPIG